MPVRVAGKAIQDLGYLHTRVNTGELFGGKHPKIYTELARTLEASEQYLNDSDTVIFASATLKRILIIFQTAKECLPSEFFNKIILHIKRVWDYSADCVCYDAIETFTALLEIHLWQCEDCLERPVNDSHANCDWINEIMQWLLEPTSLCRSRFKCICMLVERCPTLRLNLGEDFFRRTYPLLSNPSFSSVIFSLIVDNIFDREELWDLHCDFLLRSVDAKLIKTKLIPMLQKYHPSNTASSRKQKPLKPFESNTAVKFLNSLLIHLNSNNPPSDLQSQLEIVHALVTTTWPKKNAKDDELIHLVDFTHWNQCVSETVMAAAIHHVDSEVRLAAFKLLIENPRKTLVLNENDIEYIKVFLSSNMTIQAPSSRQLLISAYKFLCQRLGASSETYLKNKAASERDSDSNSPDFSSLSFENTRLAKWRAGGDTNIDPLVESYIALAKWMAKLAFESLSHKGNYYRRIMALMQIDVLFTKENFIVDGKNLFVEKLDLDKTLGSDRHKLVLQCLDDSFDLVQTIALGLLKKLDFGNINMDEDKYMSEAVGLMTSTRSRNSTSAGFRMQYYLSRKPERYMACLQKFLDDLETRTTSASEELINITSLPIHSVLNMVELLLKNPVGEESDEKRNQFYRHDILTRLIPICHRIVSIVSPVVHNMSPEGCIPDELLDSMCGKSTHVLAEISQHLLVCCWRAHKHVSGIFSWIIETVAPEGIVTKEEIEAIGTFYWTQLTECKHRGAFESATEGFFQLCQFLWTTTIEGLPKPADWLEEILAAIRGEKDLTNLCSTRRSAGLPHLVLSIVATESKKNGNAAITRATDSLLNMDGKAVEYRIHSMNVMKAIIQSSTLHERATFCYERTLKVAIDACRADWSERNAASQLFAALRTKIFGVLRSAQRSLSVDMKNRKSNYEFFSKFPSLYKFLYDQLFLEQSEFSLLPPLVLLTHLYTPPSSTELYPLRPFVPPLLEIALREKRENLRSHAIAAILAISDAYAKEDLCQWIEQFDFQNARQNHLHSFLLLIEGLGVSFEYVGRIVAVVEKILSLLAFKSWCDFNINILLQTANAYGLEYDVDEVAIDKTCLSKRPLAVKLLRDRDAFKSEMCRLLREVDTRREVYRIISKQGWEVVNKFLRAHIITIAIRDLGVADHTQQYEAKRIMQILDTAAGEEFMSKESLEQLDQLIEKRLEDLDISWSLPSTMAYAIKLKYSNRPGPDAELITWIRETYELDDPEAKEIAVFVGGTFVSRLPTKRYYDGNEKNLISAVALYLQDESELLRQRTSLYMANLIRDAGHTAINPAICRLLVIKWCLNDGDENLEKYFLDTQKIMQERDDLYDACAVNQYEEYKLFGDIQMYESSLGFGGINAEMYDIEY